MKSRNLSLFYILETLLSLLTGMIIPVYVLYFRHYQVTLLEVALLAAVFEATIILFEIPTGFFADRYGRRLSTAVGFFLFAISGAVFTLFRSFAGFLVAEIIFGIAETFISGALEALTVDSLLPEEKEKYLPKLFSNRTVFKTAGSLTGMIAGGIWASRYIQLAFVPIILLGTGGLIALFLIEPRPDGTDTSDKMTRPIRSLAKSILGSRAIAGIFLVGLLASLTFEGPDQYWQVLFSEIRGVSAANFGFITAAGAILVILAVKIGERFYNRLGLYLAVCFGATAISLLIIVRLTTFPAIAGLVFYLMFKEIYRPALSTHLNRLFDSTGRATFLSTYNLICSLGEVAAGVIVGLLAGHFGVPFIFYFAAIMSIAVPFIYLISLSSPGAPSANSI